MVQDSIRTSNHLNYKIDSTTVQINTLIKLFGAIDTMAKVVGICTTVIEYARNEGMMLEIIDIIVPQSIKEGLARDGKSAFLYGVNVPNPYPPHSYQGATWVKNNTYYIVC